MKSTSRVVFACVVMFGCQRPAEPSITLARSVRAPDVSPVQPTLVDAASSDVTPDVLDAFTIDAGVDVPSLPDVAVPARDLATLLPAMRTQPIHRLRDRFKSTNVVFRFELSGGLDVAFKPDRRGQQYWWRHDVAAFALGRLLGIADRIPAVVARRVPVRWLRRFMLSDEIIPIRRDPRNVLGSAIEWLPVLRLTSLHTEHGRKRWSRWMRVNGPQGPVPQAPDISSLIVFDYLQANEDRWNGANVRADASGRILYRDNNNGWFGFTMRNLRYGLGRLRFVQRFSRSLILALDRTTSRELAALLATESPTRTPILGRSELESFDRRRTVVLEHVRRLVARYGEQNVLCWP